MPHTQRTPTNTHCQRLQRPPPPLPLTAPVLTLPRCPHNPYTQLTHPPTCTMPTLGSMVQKGKLAACALPFSTSALNSVDYMGEGKGQGSKEKAAWGS